MKTTPTPEVSGKLPCPLTVTTADGYPIGGFIWKHPETTMQPAISPRAMVIINPATSVRCRYYFKFANFLFEHGFDVITFDYRGIGESRPASLRGFKASYRDWGSRDFEAILAHCATTCPEQPIDVVGHSIGGFVIGLAPSNPLIRRVFTVGAQYAYWPDYAPGKRLQMLLKWHIFMPLITELTGYFPGNRLGWIEDTPKGVIRQWSAFHRKFDRGVWACTNKEEPAIPIPESFARLTAPTLAISITDDEFGTTPAIERLLKLCTNSTRLTHLRISPESAGHPAIGHFAFFQNRFKADLWHIPLQWLASGQLPEKPPGTLTHLQT